MNTSLDIIAQNSDEQKKKKMCKGLKGALTKNNCNNNTNKNSMVFETFVS